jgi:IS30 family transposase
MDPVVVQRAVDGDRPGRLTIAERRDAVAQLRPRLSGARIAEQLGVTDRTVWRDIAANRTTED